MSKVTIIEDYLSLVSTKPNDDDTIIFKNSNKDYYHIQFSKLISYITEGTAGITSLTGDITSTGIGAAVTIISDNAITVNKLANSSVNLTTKVTGILPINNGGTGTSTPGLVPGTNIIITGTFPNQTINSSSGFTIQNVANYSALPTASTVSGLYYWVSSSQGTAWLPGTLGGTYYPKGLYYSNGTTWEFIDNPYQSSQGETNGEIVNDKFITPFTLGGWWTQKVVDASKITTGTFADARIASASNWNSKESAITTGTTSQYWRGDKSFQTLDKTAVGLGNIDNTSDANKPISTATQTSLNNKQPLDGDLTAIAALSTNGFAKRTGTDTWVIDTNTYLTTNQSITLSGIVTGSGTTSITTSIANGAITNAMLANSAVANLSGTNTGDNAINSLYSGLAASKQDTLISATNIKTVNGSSILGSGDLVVASSMATITATLTFTFLNEDDVVINTISSALLTTSNFKSFSYICIETTATSLDDFKLNGVTFNIQEIVDNTSFKIIASASNNATGVYTIIYKIIYQ